MLIKQTRPLWSFRDPPEFRGIPGRLAELGPQVTENPEWQEDGQGDSQRELRVDRLKRVVNWSLPAFQYKEELSKHKSPAIKWG